MENNWATENLQVIRTLMERSAIYRRALAPIMIVTGSVGLVAAVVPCYSPVASNRGFSLFWMVVGLVAVAGAFLLVRRQALKAAEPFWTPPTRRVTEALLPAYLVGLATGLVFVLADDALEPAAWLLVLVWTLAYGCALHAAAFFMQRGIRLFAWVFVAGGCALLFSSLGCPWLRTTEAAHYVMGFFFGVLHLAYGVYLYFTEKCGNAT
jgi:hypothetical protein